HARQNVQRVVVEVVTWHTSRELRFADVVDHDRTNDAGGGPGRQQPPVDCAHKLGAEHVGEIGRYSCETAAIHRQDDANGAHEYRFRTEVRRPRHQEIADDAEHEEREVGVLAPDIVGQ